MTVINPNSISGITSITLPSGSGNVLTIHTNDGTERFRIDSSGNVKVGSAATISPDGDVFFTGVTTATTFTGAHSGSGANLTSLPAAQLSGTLPALDGSALTGVASTENIRTNTNATFLQNINVSGITTVGSAVTISESGIEASGIGITCANLNGGQFGRRNKIINGAMEVAQRGTSSTSTGILTLDRMYLVVSNMDQLAYAQKQTADGPDGFSKCFEFDVTTAESALDADDLVYLRYIVEAQDLTPLFNANGTGKDFVLSFYVKAYQAGTYQVSIYKPDNTIRFLTKTYTVDASATWQRVVIPFTGDTGTSGMNSDNGQGFLIDWKLVAGTTYTSGSSQTTWGSFSNAKFAAGQAVDVSTSTNNYWRITGIQLEVGSEATAFEHRSFGEELALCQRYFYMHASGAEASANNRAPIATGAMYNTGNWNGVVNFPVTMRTSPSLYKVEGTDYFIIFGDGGSDACNSVVLEGSSPQSGIANLYGGLAQTSGTSHWGLTNNSAARLGFSSEL